MRGLGFKCALAAAAGLGVVATAATAVSTRGPTAYNQTLTLAGGSDAVDPDAPIATARYGDAPKHPVATPAPVDLAGGVSNIALAGGLTRGLAEPQLQPATRTAPAVKVAETGAAPRVAPAPWPTAVNARRSVQTLVKAERRPVQVVRIEEIKVQPFAPPGSTVGARNVTLNASALMGKVGTTEQDTRKGRWVLFAASSGRSLSFNVVRDTLDGWRGAGLSQERLARFGTHQLGLGWRKGGKQVALSATRRKLRAENYSERDVVYGVTLSIKPR